MHHYTEASTQRVEDLELMQKALEAAQRNQRRLDDNCAVLENRSGRIETVVGEIASSLRMHQVETKEAIRENTQMHENLGDTVEVLKSAFATAPRMT